MWPVLVLPRFLAYSYINYLSLLRQEANLEYALVPRISIRYVCSCRPCGSEDYQRSLNFVPSTVRPLRTCGPEYLIISHRQVRQPYSAHLRLTSVVLHLRMCAANIRYPGSSRRRAASTNLPTMKLKAGAAVGNKGCNALTPRPLRNCRAGDFAKRYSSKLV